MRTIKFRAWDKKSEKMIDYLSFGNKGQTLLNLGLYEERDLVPMQFTGLLDKNGKEIYEGDVVKRNFQDYLRGRNRLVEWTNSGGRNGWNIGQGKYWEVIGNIYENPELLK